MLICLSFISRWNWKIRMYWDTSPITGTNDKERFHIFAWLSFYIKHISIFKIIQKHWMFWFVFKCIVYLEKSKVFLNDHYSALFPVFFRDITYEISVEAVSTMMVFLSCQLFHKEVLRQSISHKYLMRGRWYASVLNLSSSLLSSSIVLLFVLSS